jgi:hypothetical protein
VIDPEGFEHREPKARKVNRTPLTARGPNHEWLGDGHDKLARLGFPIWGIRDKWSGKWLGLWVVPNNRLKVHPLLNVLRLALIYVSIFIDSNRLSISSAGP